MNLRDAHNVLLQVCGLRRGPGMPFQRLKVTFGCPSQPIHLLLN